MNATLASAGTIASSFWSPSRGPTSTIRTARSPVAVTGVLLDLHEDLPRDDGVALAHADGRHRAGGRGPDARLHLHRFQHHHRISHGDAIALGDMDGPARSPASAP